MPLSKHYSGHGKEVMGSIRKAHPGASEEKVKKIFYGGEKTRKKRKRHTVLKGE